MVVLAFFIPNTYSYADSLSAIKNSLQKGQIESNTPEQTKQNFNSTSENISKENIKNKALTKKQPIKKETPKKLSRITDTSYSPKRISETLSIKTFVATPLPTDSELLSIDSSENKLIFIKKIKDMHNELVTQDYYYLKDYLDEILRYGNKYPDICALARLYYIEGEIKHLREPIYPDGPATSSAVNDLEKELLLQKMLEEIVDTYAQGKKNIYKTCQYVVNKISDPNGWLELLKQNSNKRKEIVILDIQSRLESIKYSINELNEYETYNYTYYNKPSQYKIENSCNDIKDSYNAIIHSYLVLNNFNEAKIKFDELNNFYNSIKSEYTIHYKESYDSQDILKEKIQVKKDPNDFVKISVEYYDTLFKSQDDSINYEDLKSKLKLLSEYCDEVPHVTVIDGKTIETEYGFNNTGIKNSAKFLYDKMALPLEIYRLYFMKYDNYSYHDIHIPENTLLLKCETNRPITKKIQCVIESSISKRSKNLIFKRSTISDSEYYIAFLPNETNNMDDKDKNLINNEKDAFKESIATFRGDIAYNGYKNFLNGKYFKENFLNSTVEKDDVNIDKGTIENSVNFLKSGGAELLTCTIGNQTAKTLVKHQADWFIINGHCGPYTAYDEHSSEVGEKGPLGIKPLDLLEKINSGTFISKDYNENMDVLILASCYCLNWGVYLGYDQEQYAKGWYQVLPQGLILGFNDEVEIHLINRAVRKLSEFVIEQNEPLSKEKIAKAWHQANKDAYNESLIKSNKKFAYIYMNKYYCGKLNEVIGFPRRYDLGLDSWEIHIK
jgi:hypothetical protein